MRWTPTCNVPYCGLRNICMSIWILRRRHNTYNATCPVLRGTRSRYCYEQFHPSLPLHTAWSTLWRAHSRKARMLGSLSKCTTYDTSGLASSMQEHLYREELYIKYITWGPVLQSTLTEARLILDKVSRHGYGGQGCAIAPNLQGNVQGIKSIGKRLKELANCWRRATP